MELDYYDTIPKYPENFYDNIGFNLEEKILITGPPNKNTNRKV